MWLCATGRRICEFSLGFSFEERKSAAEWWQGDGSGKHETSSRRDGDIASPFLPSRPPWNARYSGSRETWSIDGEYETAINIWWAYLGTVSPIQCLFRRPPA